MSNRVFHQVAAEDYLKRAKALFDADTRGSDDLGRQYGQLAIAHATLAATYPPASTGAWGTNQPLGNVELQATKDHEPRSNKPFNLPAVDTEPPIQ